MDTLLTIILAMVILILVLIRIEITCIVRKIREIDSEIEKMKDI